MADFCCLCVPCCCCRSADLNSKFRAAKWFYFGVFAFSAIGTWAVRDFAEELLEWVPPLESCKEQTEHGDVSKSCFRKGAVLRLSFALFVFHLIHALFLFQCKSTDDSRSLFHTECLGLKLTMWIGIVVLSFFIPESFYDVYGELARILSGIFLVFQALVVIDLIYRINEAMLDRDDCMFPLIIGSIGAFVIGLICIGVGYGYYAPRISCSTNVFWITWTLIFGIVITMISITPWRNEKAGLFTSGVVFSYCGFLLLTA